MPCLSLQKQPLPEHDLNQIQPQLLHQRWCLGPLEQIFLDQQKWQRFLAQKEFVEMQRNKIDIAVLRAENRKTTVADYPVEYQNIDQLVGNGTDWYDLILQTAPIQEHNLSIQRGTQDSKINASFGYFKQDGA